MKTIQPFTDPNKIKYNLPAPTYTSTEGNMLLKERFSKDSNLPDIKKGSYDYRKQYSGVSDHTNTEDDAITASR